MAIFELYKGGVFGIFISKALNGDHSAHGRSFSFLAEAFVSMNADDLAETQILFNFLFFWHLDIINFNKITLKSI